VLKEKGGRGEQKQRNGVAENRREGEKSVVQKTEDRLKAKDGGQTDGRWQKKQG